MHALPPLATTAAYRPPVSETRTTGAAPVAGTAQSASPPPPQGNAATAPVMATVVDEEPIWRGARGLSLGADSWDQLNTPTKIVVATIGCAGLAYNANLVFGLIVPLVVFYIIYRIVRSVVLQYEAKSSGKAHPLHGNAPRPPEPPPAAARPAPAAASRPDLQATAYHPTSQTPADGDWRAASKRHWKHARRRCANRPPWRSWSSRRGIGWPIWPVR